MPTNSNTTGIVVTNDGNAILHSPCCKVALKRSHGQGLLSLEMVHTGDGEGVHVFSTSFHDAVIIIISGFSRVELRVAQRYVRERSVMTMKFATKMCMNRLNIQPLA